MEKGTKTSNSSLSSKLSGVTSFLQRVGPVLKWILFGVLVVLVLVALFRGGLGWLANFSDWAKRLLQAWRNFWAKLFGRRHTGGEEGEGEEEGPPQKPERPFSAFANPFDTGEAARLSARDLVRYTFAAFEAWGRERDMARAPGETAGEWVRRVTEEVPALEADSRALLQLHARAEYARGGMPVGTAEMVRKFWETLGRVVEAPLSA
jgi:hypothetical protein